MSKEDRTLAHAIEMKAVTDRLDDCITKRAHFDLKELMETRFEALDRFIDERTKSQQAAIKDALAAAKEATGAALVSAERAVSKAETANERRFDAVNEFRKQLSDQTTTFIPRIEAEARINVVGDKLDSEIARSTAQRTDMEQRLQAQLNTLTTQAAATQGATANRTSLMERGQFTVTTALGAVGVFVAVIAVAADILVRIFVK